MLSISTIKRLREDGFRIGRVRKNIVELFENSTKPISAQDIVELLFHKNISANKTTVYRELDFLREKG
ncbi:MAG: hypothetical protein UU14_C0003G0001, partial [Candidatus Roizmanbacteria bacterium GW2011_GWB1_40_7]